MLTGGSYEDGWMPQAQEVDPKTRLARLGACATNGYADIRARIPQWVPTPLVDLMMRCLRLDRTQRPTMEAVATEIQTLRSVMSHACCAAVGPRPAQFWMHTSHISLDLTVDYTMLRDAGVFECLYGPRFRDRMKQNFNPSTNRCRTIAEKKTAKTPGARNARTVDAKQTPEITRKIIEYKSKFFRQTVLPSVDGREVLPRGIRHLPSYARGAMLLEDYTLTAFVNRLDKPSYYPKDHKWCAGAPDQCRCERTARPKNPGIVTKIPTPLLHRVMSFLEFPDYGALARVCKITAKEAHKVWTTKEAIILWGFTSKQLDKIPFWCFGTEKRFTTADLLDFRKKLPMLRKLKKPKKIEPDLYNRVPDLPEEVRQYVAVNPPHPALQVKAVTQLAHDPLTEISIQYFDMEAMFSIGNSGLSPEPTVAQQLSSITATDANTLVGTASLVEEAYTIFYRKKPEQLQPQPDQDQDQDQFDAPRAESIP